MTDPKALLSKTAPSCLRPLRKGAVKPTVAAGDPFTTAWRIGCACGTTSGSILGYPLAGFDSTYKGPITFVSPLGFDCTACGKITEILDTDLHGYNSEVGKLEGGGGSAAYRGEGERVRFACPKCGKQRFDVTMKFAYWDGAFDLFLEEPELPCADFFNLAECLGKCAGCGTIAPAAELEC